MPRVRQPPPAGRVRGLRYATPLRYWAIRDSGVTNVVDYERAFNDFDAAGGRHALEHHLAELDRVAQAAMLEGGEPDPRLMALREGLQQLLAALNDLANSAETPHPSRGPKQES